jgi:queuine tRNA-ribosyltransferase
VTKRDQFNFSIDKRLEGTFGRAGTISTPHGIIETPAFISVGTKATVKALTPEHIKETRAQAVLANAYHLYLQPGHEIIDAAGGVAKYMNWHGPTFTDSGGFQVLSLGVGYKKVLALDTTSVDTSMAVAQRGERLAKVDDDGVTFRSHIDGSRHRFTPEVSMQIQHGLGADIIFAFDECTSIMQPYAYQRTALDRTHAWALRCIEEHKRLSEARADKPYQALYGVIQGANYEDLRREAAKTMATMDFDGYGFGGAFDKHELGTILTWVNEHLPEEKPRHLLGLSEPDDIFTGVENGADTFDCVAPARVARNGAIYTRDGRISIRKAQYKQDFSPLVEGCECYTCTNYSKSYVNHLFRASERLAATLATIHNEYFIIKLTRDIRTSILDGTYAALKDDWLSRYYA